MKIFKIILFIKIKIWGKGGGLTIRLRKVVLRISFSRAKWNHCWVSYLDVCGHPLWRTFSKCVRPNQRTLKKNDFFFKARWYRRCWCILKKKWESRKSLTYKFKNVSSKKVVFINLINFKRKNNALPVTVNILVKGQYFYQK